MALSTLRCLLGHEETHIDLSEYVTFALALRTTAHSPRIASCSLTLGTDLITTDGDADGMTRVQGLEVHSDLDADVVSLLVLFL